MVSAGSGGWGEALQLVPHERRLIEPAIAALTPKKAIDTHTATVRAKFSDSRLAAKSFGHRNGTAMSLRRKVWEGVIISIPPIFSITSRKKRLA